MKNNEKKDFIIIHNRNEIKKIPENRILYISQRGRQVLIKTDFGEYQEYEKLKNIYKYLDNNFLYVLKYTIANYDRVTAIKDQCIMFDNGEVFNLGRANYGKVKKDFISYITTK